MILNFLLFVERFLFIQRKLYSLFGCPKGAVFCPTAVGTRGKGGIFFPKRIPPLEPPEKGKGSYPLTPHIGSFYLEELHALRIAQPLAALLPYGCGIPLAGNQVRCTWLRHESLRVGSFSNRALLS